MRNSQRGIDAFIDQVHKPVEHIEVHRHRRIGVEKVIQNRMQHLLAAGDRRRHGKGAARGRSLACRQDIGLLEIGQHAPAGGGIALAGLAQLDQACRAVEQLHADIALEEGHGAADGGGRASELAARAGKAPFVERGDEDLHGVDAVHRLLRILQDRMPKDGHSAYHPERRATFFARHARCRAASLRWSAHLRSPGINPAFNRTLEECLPNTEYSLPVDAAQFEANPFRGAGESGSGVREPEHVSSMRCKNRQS